MKVNQQIQLHLDEANKLALNEVERIVRSILSNNSKLGGFFMAMGTYCFEDLNFENLNDYDHKRLLDFIQEWDSSLCITGEPLKLRKVNGSIVKFIY